MTSNKSGFSLYDIEQFLKDAGAERVNEKAVRSLQSELNDTVNLLLEEAAVYANYAGRTRVIRGSDVALTTSKKGATRHIRVPVMAGGKGKMKAAAMNRHMRKRNRISGKVAMAIRA